MSLDSNMVMMNIQEQAEIVVVGSFLHETAIPGLPAPLTGERFKALCDSIEKDGMVKPIIVDENDHVWDGRSRLRACIKLGRTHVKIIRINSQRGERIARLSAMHRQWTPLEMANTIQWVLDSDELDSLRQKEPLQKTNVLIGRWMTQELGMVKGVSPRQVANYIKLSSGYKTLSSVTTRAQVENAATLNEALKYIPEEEKANRPQRGKKLRDCKMAFERLTKSLKALGKFSALKSALAKIEAAMAA